MPRKRTTPATQTPKKPIQKPKPNLTGNTKSNDPVTEEIQNVLAKIDSKYKLMEASFKKITANKSLMVNKEQETEITTLKEENSKLEKIIKLYNMLTCLYIDKTDNEYITTVKKGKKDYFTFKLTKKKNCFLVQHENNKLDDSFFDNDIEFKPQFLINYMAKIMEAITGSKNK